MSIFAEPQAIKKRPRRSFFGGLMRGAEYEAHAERQADAEWLKLKVCDLDLSRVRLAEQGQRFVNLC